MNARIKPAQELVLSLGTGLFANVGDTFRAGIRFAVENLPAGRDFWLAEKALG